MYVIKTLLVLTIKIIAMSASQFNGSSQVDIEFLNFPTVEDLVNYTQKIQPLVAKLPPGLIEEMLQDTGMDASKISKDRTVTHNGAKDMH